MLCCVLVCVCGEGWPMVVGAMLCCVLVCVCGEGWPMVVGAVLHGGDN